jgi:hypothetical protein
MYESPPYSADSFSWLAKTTEEDIERMVIDIITKLDFELIIPTAYDFLQNYLEQTERGHLTAMQVSAINTITLVLVYNYQYAIEYTPEQLAQIVLEALDIHLKCLDGVLKLYDSRIYNYLKNLQIPDQYYTLKQRYILALEQVKSP